MSEVYNKINSLCINKGITPGGLCDAIGIARSTLSYLKSGRTSSLSASNVLKIANYFGVTANEILDGSSANNEIIPITISQKLTEEEQALLNLFRSMNYTGRKKIIEMSEDMVELPKYRKEQI